jgi:hypothetical protein
VDVEERFAGLVETMLREEGVQPPVGGSGFGAGSLRVGRWIFATLVRGQLVVKLPRSRVDELVSAGEGVRFDANKGVPMKEWLVLDVTSALDWEDLAGEALAFAKS